MYIVTVVVKVVGMYVILILGGIDLVGVKVVKILVLGFEVVVAQLPEMAVFLWFFV